MAKFIVNYSYRASATSEVFAESIDEAKAKIQREIDGDDFDPGFDEIHDVDFAINEMHAVTRKGREIWSTYVFPTDIRGHQSALNATPLFANIG